MFPLSAHMRAALCTISSVCAFCIKTVNSKCRWPNSVIKSTIATLNAWYKNKEHTPLMVQNAALHVKIVET